MRRFLALTRKEASGILMSPPILFATAFFVLLDSFAFYLMMTREGAPVAVFDEAALFMLFTSIFMYPLVSMRAFSEDNVSGTLETLLTAPVSHFAAVIGKWVGCMSFVLLYQLHGLVHAALLSYGGNLDWNAALAALLTHLAFGSVAMAAGVFFSTLTVTPAAAAAATGGALLFLTLAADFDPYSGALSDLLHTASFFPYARRWIGGQLDTRGLVYFVSCTALFLFYAWLAIRSRQPEKRTADATVRRRLTVTYALVALGAVLLLVQAAVLHIRGFWESGTPSGPNLARVPWLWLIPLGCAAAAFAWSFLTSRAARRAARAHRRGAAKYATITESQVMRAPRYYYKENLLGRRRVILAAVASLVLALTLNWLAHYPFRTFEGSGRLAFLARLQERNWDVTHDGRNSLSPTTRRALDALRERVRIYSFLPEGLEVSEVPVEKETRLLLNRYADYNQQVSVAFADAVREPELAGDLATELDIPASSLAEQVVVDCQNRQLAIPASALANEPPRDRQTPDSPRRLFDGENRLTRAILHLSDPGVPATEWLAGRDDSRDIEPRAWVDRRIRLTGAQMRAVLWMGVVALPLAWLLAGISAWWLRRE
jgi:ABC-2 type transport system permease protein